MNAIDLYKFQQEIKLFKEKLAPTDKQWNYLNGSKGDIEKEILKTAREQKQPVERVLLTSICGELDTKQKQSEFAARLLLLDLLTE